MLRRRATFAPLLALAAFACADDPADDRDTILLALRAQNVEPNAAVATVNGRSIEVGAFAAIVSRAAPGRTRRDVLDDLITAELLYEEAVQGGYGETEELKLARRRLMVQAMLRDRFERDLPPSLIKDEEIEAYYKANPSLYNNPQLRDADHLLVQFDPDTYDVRANPEAAPPALRQQAHELAEAIKADLDRRNLPQITAVELRALAEEWDARTPPGLRLHVESGVRTPRRDFGSPGQAGYIPAVVTPFADAAFEATPGVPTAPVDTVFGTHIIVVTRDEPALRIPLADAAEGIRAFLLHQRRQAAFTAWLNALVRQADARIDASAPDRLEPQSAPAP